MMYFGQQWSKIEYKYMLILSLLLNPLLDPPCSQGGVGVGWTVIQKRLCWVQTQAY